MAESVSFLRSLAAILQPLSAAPTISDERRHRGCALAYSN